MNLDVGSQIGDYQVVGILGAGGMGKVYKVRNLISDRVEALKVLLPDLANEPDLADRFLREIKVQASLEHPNIAALHTAVRVDNQLLMLMEMVEGVTLEQRLREAPLPMGEAVNYIMQVLAALEYAHGRGVIHRDIKPANMMLTPSGVVKLMDFGIAKAATDRKLTMTGTTMGSLYYMSPEQIQGVPHLDPRSDLYSVGVSLYELATGKRPFDGDSQFAIMAAHLEKAPVPPIQIDPRLPQMLNDVILMSVAKDPSTRFQSATAFRNALSNVAQPAAPVLAPTLAVADSAQPAAASGRRGLWMAVGAVTVALAVVGVIQFGPKKGTKAAQPITPHSTSSTATAPVQTPSPSPQPSAPAAQPQVQPDSPAAIPNHPLSDTGAPVQKPSAHSVARVPAPPAQSTPSQATPVQTPTLPVQQPPAQVQPTPLQQQPPQQMPPQADNTALRAELQNVREELMKLNVRAESLRGTLQSMQRQMAPANLSPALQNPANLMNSYLEGAAAALEHSDPGKARDFMQKADRQVEILEGKLRN